MKYNKVSQLITAFLTLAVLASLLAVTPQVARAQSNHLALQRIYNPPPPNESFLVTRNQSGVIVTDTKGATDYFVAVFTIPCVSPSITAPLGTEVEFYMQVGAAPSGFEQLGLRWRPGEGWTPYWALGGNVPYSRHFARHFHPKCHDQLVFELHKKSYDLYTGFISNNFTGQQLISPAAFIDPSQVAWLTKRPRCFGQLSLLPDFHQITWYGVEFFGSSSGYRINDVPHTIVTMVDSRNNVLASSREYSLQYNVQSNVVTTWDANGVNGGLC